MKGVYSSNIYMLKKPVNLIYMDNCICTNKLLIGNKNLKKKKRTAIPCNSKLLTTYTETLSTSKTHIFHPCSICTDLVFCLLVGEYQLESL